MHGIESAKNTIISIGLNDEPSELPTRHFLKPEIYNNGNRFFANAILTIRCNLYQTKGAKATSHLFLPSRPTNCGDADNSRFETEQAPCNTFATGLRTRSGYGVETSAAIFYTMWV